MKEKTFEEKLNRVEQISSLLESEDVSIDDSIALFSEGASLIKELNEILNDAQRKVESIAGNEE